MWVGEIKLLKPNTSVSLEPLKKNFPKKKFPTNVIDIQLVIIVRCYEKIKEN